MLDNIEQVGLEKLGLTLAYRPLSTLDGQYFTVNQAVRRQISHELARRFEFSRSKAEAKLRRCTESFITNSEPDNWNQVHAMMYLVQALSPTGTLGKEAKD